MCPQDFFHTVALEDLVISNQVTVNPTTTGLSPRFPTGRPVFMEDFELAWPNWATVLFGPGAVSQRQVVNWYSRGAAWELTVADPGPEVAQVYAYLGRLPQGNIGISWCWAFTAAAYSLIMNLEFPVGATVHSLSLEYEGASGDIRVLDDTLGYVSVISAPPMELSATCYHFVKLTGRMVEGEYALRTLKFNEYEVGLSAYVPDAYAAPADYPIVIAFTNLHLGGYPCSVYLDNISLTTDE